MPTTNRGAKATHFDLGKTAGWLKHGEVHSLRTARFVILLFGAAMLLADLAAWFGLGFAPSAKTEGPFYLLLFFGAGLAAWQGSLLAIGARVAVDLSIDEREAVFKDTKGRLTRLTWRDPRFCLNIIDRRSVPVARRNTKVDSLVFVINDRGLPLVGLTPEALDAILAAARHHGLAVSGWSLNPSEVPASQWIRIRAD